MNENEPRYRTAGVDVAAAEIGLGRLAGRIRKGWPAAGGRYAVILEIGYFANVIDIGGGVGLAISTDGVGTKSIVAQMMNRYDTIGIDCVAMNVNDVICVGARPISMVDYIALERADPEILDAIAIGLAAGAASAGISISGGETAILGEAVKGFDLVGTAVGLVPLDRVLTGRDLAPGDVVIGLESSGVHSNGFSLARQVLFRDTGLAVDRVVAELGVPLGEELLRPTSIYVPEILEIVERVPGVKALVNITGDGLLNLARVEARVGFVIDNPPQPPAIFQLIERLGAISPAEMYQVFNMGIGFCVLAAEADAAAILAILAGCGRRAEIIGRVVADPERRVRLPHKQLVGRGKRFARE